MTVTDLVAGTDVAGTTVAGFVCAPVEENEMSFTPEVSSVAVSVIVTVPFAQSPNVYAAPPAVGAAVVTGAVVSAGYV